MNGVTLFFIALIHSAMTPTEVLRSLESLPLTNFRIGLSYIFQSSAKVPPRATAMPISTSRALSIVSQSYSEVSSRRPKSSSYPKSFWQGCVLVIIESRISHTVLKVPWSAMRAGPVSFRVSARERLISVTVALNDMCQRNTQI